MRFYYVSDTMNSMYCATLIAAHSEAKNMARFDVEIVLVEIDTTQDNMLRLLNKMGGTERAIRKWTLTERGGLKEEST